VLFVTLLTEKPGKSGQEVMEQAFKWADPPGTKTVAEYWLQTPDPRLIVVSEANDIGPFMAASMYWGDFFSITVVPAVTVEQGMEMAKKMMG